MENQTLNRIEVRGRIGQDPKITPVGEKAVARFCVATSEIYKERGGGIKEETTWHNISIWSDRTQVNLSQLKKGDLVSVTGRIRNNKYTSEEGTDRYYSEIVANRLMLADVPQS